MILFNLMIDISVDKNDGYITYEDVFRKTKESKTIFFQNFTMI